MKYVKLFEEFEENTFTETNPEEMKRIAGGKLPKEFVNKDDKDKDDKDKDDKDKEVFILKLKFAGKDYNFGITEDKGLFKVYKWRSIFELKEIGECDTLEKAKNLVIENNK